LSAFFRLRFQTFVVSFLQLNFKISVKNRVKPDSEGAKPKGIRGFFEISPNRPKHPRNRPRPALPGDVGCGGLSRFIPLFLANRGFPKFRLFFDDCGCDFQL
jgi:hypothetical protein